MDPHAHAFQHGFIASYENEIELKSIKKFYLGYVFVGDRFPKDNTSTVFPSSLAAYLLLYLL
jgi:hypothetical protein